MEAGNLGVRIKNSLSVYYQSLKYLFFILMSNSYYYNNQLSRSALNIIIYIFFLPFPALTMCWPPCSTTSRSRSVRTVSVPPSLSPSWLRPVHRSPSSQHSWTSTGCRSSTFRMVCSSHCLSSLSISVRWARIISMLSRRSLKMHSWIGKFRELCIVIPSGTNVACQSSGPYSNYPNWELLCNQKLLSLSLLH